MTAVMAKGRRTANAILLALVCFNKSSGECSLTKCDRDKARMSKRQ